MSNEIHKIKTKVAPKYTKKKKMQDKHLARKRKEIKKVMKNRNMKTINQIFYE
jgi:hypothetical protein